MSGFENTKKRSPESESDWENRFWDAYSKEKGMQEQISTIEALKNYISKHGLQDLTPWAIDTISKATNAMNANRGKMSINMKKQPNDQHDLTDLTAQIKTAQKSKMKTPKMKVESEASSKKTPEKRSSPETDAENDAKAENFIKSGLVGTGAGASSTVSDLNNYFHHANAAQKV